MNEQHRQQWLAEQQGKPSKRNLGSLLRGGGGAGAQEPEGPPPTYLEQMRQHVRETFAQEHEQMKVQQDQMMKTWKCKRKNEGNEDDGMGTDVSSLLGSTSVTTWSRNSSR
ncbi:unnamed protein product [Absidia cylindrospora]